MSEHLLHNLDVRARGNRQRGCSVPQRVRVQCAEIECSGRIRKHSSLKHLRAQRSASRTREYEIRGCLPNKLCGQLLYEKSRNGHRSAFVTLRRAPGLNPAYKGH